MSYPVLNKNLVVSPTGSTATATTRVPIGALLRGVFWSAYFQSKIDADTAVAQLRLGTTGFEATVLGVDRGILSEIRMASVVGVTFQNYNSNLHVYHPLGVIIGENQTINLIAAANSGTIQVAAILDVVFGG